MKFMTFEERKKKIHIMDKKPRVMIFPVTYKCNAKCCMCTIWERKDFDSELKMSEINTLFDDSLLVNYLESINFTGGEPTLRKDLIDIVQLVIIKCKGLREIALNCNGFNTKKVIEICEAILKAIEKYKRVEKFKFNIYISLDGIGKTHDKVRGIPGGFKKVEKTLQELKKLEYEHKHFYTNINCTITKENAFELQDVRDYGIEHGYSIGYTYAMVTDVYIDSNKNSDKFRCSVKEKKAVVEFLDNLIKNPRLVNISRFYFESLRDMVNGEPRHIPCIFPTSGCFLEPDGTLLPCGTSKDLVYGNIRDRSFSEIWNDKKTDRIRKKAFDVCKTCETNCYVDWNEEIIELKKNIG